MTRHTAGEGMTNRLTAIGLFLPRSAGDRIPPRAEGRGLLREVW